MSDSPGNDNDTLMHSSSSLDVDSEEMMFPTSDTIPTAHTSTPPHHPTQLYAPPAGELSPPSSQHDSSAIAGTMIPGQILSGDAMDIMAHDGQVETAGMAPDNNGGDAKPSKQGEDKTPGAAWNNKKAHEEYIRVMDTILDDKFTLSDLGDPFDESDMLIGA